MAAATPRRSESNCAGQGVKISESEIFYLATKFIVYLCLAHRESQGEIKELLDRNGGYILHVDATREGDSPHLMTGLDGITEIEPEKTSWKTRKWPLRTPTRSFPCSVG